MCMIAHMYISKLWAYKKNDEILNVVTTKNDDDDDVVTTTNNKKKSHPYHPLPQTFFFVFGCCFLFV